MNRDNHCPVPSYEKSLIFFKQKSRGRFLCFVQHAGGCFFAQPKRPTIMLEG
jgi:hypothetical protein